ncbi:MAG: hypothetical protein U0744_09530 [Gemmataceae bacterium]
MPRHRLLRRDHGDPRRTDALTWVKLKKRAGNRRTTLSVMEPVTDWKPGDLVVLGSTHRA